MGRSPSSAVQLSWDEEVSALHAQLEVVGDELTLVDEGISRNGSFVNGERVGGRSRLRDGDMLRFGQTMVLFRAPALTEAASTVVASDALSAAAVSPAQRRVLVALCRPFKDGAAFAIAADEPTARGRASSERGRSQDAHAGSVREVRRAGAAAEPQAGRCRRARAPDRPDHAARALKGANPHQGVVRITPWRDTSIPWASGGAGPGPGDSGSSGMRTTKGEPR